jgi:hypothetical protein
MPALHEYGVYNEFPNEFPNVRALAWLGVKGDSPQCILPINGCRTICLPDKNKT